MALADVITTKGQFFCTKNGDFLFEFFMQYNFRVVGNFALFFLRSRSRNIDFPALVRVSEPCANYTAKQTRKTFKLAPKSIPAPRGSLPPLYPLIREGDRQKF